MTAGVCAVDAITVPRHILAWRTMRKIAFKRSQDDQAFGG